MFFAPSSGLLGADRLAFRDAFKLLRCVRVWPQSAGAQKGGDIWDRLTVHYTPKHGRWLNQAEIELIKWNGSPSWTLFELFQLHLQLSNCEGTP
jgi:hypothetical protein